jgi:pilus assembly protein CpaE
MLTAAIATSDTSGSGEVLASLQQTGLVSWIKQWIIPGEKFPDATDAIPDVVILDLSRDPEPYFALGAHLRRLRPAVRLIACSANFPPNQQLLLDAMRNGVQDFIPRPVTPDVLREILTRLGNDVQHVDFRPSQKLIVVMGAKGGVGATSVAVNLGVQLSTFAHKRVVLLDFARPLGNVHLLLDLHPRFGIRDAVDNLDRLDSHFFGGLLTRHKTKLETLGGVLQPEEWQTIPVGPLERVINVAQAGFEIVLADMGSQFSSDLSGVLLGARMVLLVTEANVPSLWNLERRLVALTGFGIDPDRVRVVVNRWHKGDEEVLKSIERDIRRPVFACLPNDFRKASQAVNLGTPLMENHNNTLTHRYRHLVSQLLGTEALGAAKKSGLSNFFSFSGKR